MARNLDMTALRSFVAVADSGGVTRAAGFLNLTQSAVSMQLKRLEEALAVSLIDRSARRVTLTSAGEKLLGYARRMLDLNDEVYRSMTDRAFEGVVVLGVPSDIVFPAIPRVLQQFTSEFPRMKVQLISSYTRKLREMFARGEADVILTTEDNPDAKGETLTEVGLAWIGAQGGSAWKQRPLRLAFETNCIFRGGAVSALDAAGISWEMAVESDSTRTIEATVSADFAIHAMVEGSAPSHLEKIAHGGALPELPPTKINLYAAEASSEPVRDLASMLRRGYAVL